MWLSRNSSLHVLHFMPWTRCECILTRVLITQKLLHFVHALACTLFLIRWLKIKKWIGISVDVKTIADFQIGWPLRNKNSRKTCATMPSLSEIFPNTIGSIDDSTPSSWSLFVKPKLIEIFKVSDKIQAIGNATVKISFSLSSKDSRKCLGTVKLLATALVVLLIGCSSGMFKNSRAK